MDFARGYHSAFVATFVDSKNWQDASEAAGVLSFSATRSLEGDAPTVDSGDLELEGSLEGERYLRVWMLADALGEYVRVPLGTYLAEEAGREGERASELTLRSVLTPASERSVAVGWYVPAGSNGPRAAARLLEDCLDAPVRIATGEDALLVEGVVAGKDSALTMAWAVLNACGWELTTTTLGEVVIRPKQAEPAVVRECDVIGKIRQTLGLAGIPNAVTVSDGSASVTVINDDPASPSSTVSRGRRVDLTNNSSSRAQGETLETWGRRLLREASVACETAEYSREWREDIGPGDVVRLPGIEGAWRVATQQIGVGAGVSVSESVKREVVTYGTEGI